MTLPFSAPALAPPADIPPPPFVPSALFTIFSRSERDGYPPEAGYVVQKVVKFAFPPSRSLRSCSSVHLSMVTERTKLRVGERRSRDVAVRLTRCGRRSLGRGSAVILIPSAEHSLRWIPEHSRQINVPCYHTISSHSLPPTTDSPEHSPTAETEHHSRRILQV